MASSDAILVPGRTIAVTAMARARDAAVVEVQSSVK